MDLQVSKSAFTIPVITVGTCWQDLSSTLDNILDVVDSIMILVKTN